MENFVAFVGFQNSRHTKGYNDLIHLPNRTHWLSTDNETMEQTNLQIQIILLYIPYCHTADCRSIPKSNRFFLSFQSQRVLNYFNLLGMTMNRLDSTDPSCCCMLGFPELFCGTVDDFHGNHWYPTPWSYPLSGITMCNKTSFPRIAVGGIAKGSAKIPMMNVI